MATEPKASAVLHPDPDIKGEPLWIDLNVTLTCGSCGKEAEARAHVYKPVDVVGYRCQACGMEVAVTITTSLSFACVVQQIGQTPPPKKPRRLPRFLRKDRRWHASTGPRRRRRHKLTRNGSLR